MSKSQRTKNNVRPASSWRSAELLNNNVGFGTMLASEGAKPPLLASLSDNTNVDHLSNDFVLCLKKVNKKDPISKNKALQELTSLVKASTTEEVNFFLPHWARLYPTLCTDIDHKVRESTQICHGAICEGAGRGLAKHLHAVGAAWLAAQYDPASVTAHSQAKQHLKRTFPGTKFADMLVYCQNDVMDYVIENVIQHTHYTLRKKDESEENASQRYGFIATTSMGSLAALVRDPNTRETLYKRVEGLLKAKQYWTLVNIPTVRSMWLELTSAVMSSYPVLSAQYVTECACVVVDVSRHAVCDPGLWTCLLDLWTRHQDCAIWKRQGEEMKIRLNEFFEKGDVTVARLAPALIQRMPESVTDEAFYRNAFFALHKGLHKKCIINSKMERDLWIGGIVECAGSVCDRPHVPADLYLVWLDPLLGGDPTVVADLAPHVGRLLRALLPLPLPPAHPRRRHAEALLQHLPSLLRPLPFPSPHQNRVGHALLFLHELATYTPAPKRRVTFADDQQEPEQEDPELTKSYREWIKPTVHTVCVEYLRNILGEEQRWSVPFYPLNLLLDEFGSRSLYEETARNLGCEDPYCLYEKAYLPKLRQDMPRELVEPLVENIFIVKRHFYPAELEAMFATFDRLPLVAVRSCLRADVQGGGAWARGAGRAGVYRRVVAAACSGSEPDYRTIQDCLKLLPTEVPEHCELVRAMVEETSLRMCGGPAGREGPHKSARPACEWGVRLGALLLEHMAPSGPPDSLRAPHRDLQRTVLAVLLRHDPKTSGYNSWSWSDAARVVRSSSTWAPLDTLFNDIHTHLVLASPEVNISEIEHAARTAWVVNPGAVIPSGDDSTSPASPAETFALRYDNVVGRLDCPTVGPEFLSSLTADHHKELDKHQLVSFANDCLFRLSYLKEIVVGEKGKAFSNEDVRNEWNKCLRECAILRSLYNGYVFWPHYRMIQVSHQHADTVLRHVVAHTSAAHRPLLLDRLDTLAGTLGHYWAYARAHYRKLCHDTPCHHTYTDIDTDVNRNDADTNRSDADATTNTDANTTRIDADTDDTDGDTDGKDVDKNRNDADANGTDVDTDRSDADTNHTDTDANTNIPSGDGYFHQLQAESSIEDRNTQWALAARYFHLSHTYDVSPVVSATISALSSPDVSPDAIDSIIQTYYKHNHLMLYDIDLSDSSWTSVMSNASVARALFGTVGGAGWDMADSHWDFSNISVCSWLNSIVMSKHIYYTTQVASLTYWSLNLLSSTDEFVRAIPSECTRREPPPHLADMVTEWADVFLPNILPNLADLLIHVLESAVRDDEMTSCRMCAIRACVEAVRSAGSKAYGGKAAALWHAAGAVLARPAHYAYKYLAAEVARGAGEHLVRGDEKRMRETEAADEGGEEGAGAGGAGGAGEDLLTLAAPYMVSLQEQVRAVMARDFGSSGRDTKTVAVPLWSESHSVVLGYLLLADALLGNTAIAIATATHHHYTRAYMENKWVEELLSVVMKLLPAPVLERRTDDLPERYTPFFTETPKLDLTVPIDETTISRLACRACWNGVVSCAAAVRWWACGAAGGAGGGARLQAVLRRYVTPAILAGDLAKVHALHSPDTQISVRPSTREVVCRQRIEEERYAELQVICSDAHPLWPPTVTVTGASANAHYHPAQWANLSALVSAWSRSVRVWVKRAAVCYVCYARLHHASGKLPTATCRTCHNKFHRECLDKWFSTSKDTKCPLCRTQF